MHAEKQRPHRYFVSSAKRCIYWLCGGLYVCRHSVYKLSEGVLRMVGYAEPSPAGIQNSRAGPLSPPCPMLRTTFLACVPGLSQE